MVSVRSAVVASPARSALVLKALVLAGLALVGVGACKKTEPPAPDAMSLAPFVRSLPHVKSGAPLTRTARVNVFVTKTNIAVESDLIVAPLTPQDGGALGIDAKYKRNGPNNLYVVPLANAVGAVNDRVNAGGRTDGDGGLPSGDARLAIDGDVPFRVVTDVMFTLGQTKISTFHLVAPSANAPSSGASTAKRDRAAKDDLVQIDLTLPRASQVHVLRQLGDPPPTPAELYAMNGLNLSVFVVNDGFSIKARGGNVAPGCNDVGAGLAIANDPNGARAYAQLAACLVKLKASSPEFANEREVTLTGSATIPYKEILATIDVVRGEKSELFPDVRVGVAR